MVYSSKDSNIVDFCHDSTKYASIMVLAAPKVESISMIHFLVKREDERAQENQELKDMVKELRDTHKQDVKTQTNLLKSIDRLTNQVADLTTQNRMISERIAELAQALPSRD